MLEMIGIYLEQTPLLINTMELSFRNKDWLSLKAAVHKMVPSFAIMGMSSHFEDMAKKVQEFATTQQKSDGISSLVLQLATVCTQACAELQETFNSIKNTNTK
jgi:hypothetical protein